MATINNPELVFAVVPRVAAAFSLLGSSFIVAEVCRDRRKRSRVYHRIVAGMSLFDIVGSICYFLGRWPLPPDAEFLPGGVGNQQTCTAQAFFGQAVVATVTYNTILAVQYLMIISFGISEKQIARKYEKFMHAIPVLVWLTTGALGIAFEVFNPAFFNCWIAPVPINCAAAGEIPDGRPECTRGYLAPIFQWAIFYAPIWAMIAIVTGIMLKVYCGVRKTERRNSLYASASGDAKAQMKHSRRVAKQGLWYLLPFYATWIFPVATEITEMVTGNYYDPMVVLVSFFLPFQGALNFMVYMRPRFLKYRRDNPEWSLPMLVYRTLKKSLCCTKNGDEDDFVTEGPERRGSARRSSFDAVAAKFARRRSSSFDNNDRRSTVETDNGAPAVRVVSSLVQGEMGVAADEDLGNNTHDVEIVGDEEELEKDFSYRDMWAVDADEADDNDDAESDKVEEVETRKRWRKNSVTGTCG
ncbi:hypothetical protein ACHAXT_011475 [Thalassiosira profunda]